MSGFPAVSEESASAHFDYPIAPGRERASFLRDVTKGSYVADTTVTTVDGAQLDWSARSGTLEGPEPSIEELMERLNIRHAFIERAPRRDLPLVYVRQTLLVSAALTASVVAFFASPTLGVSPVYAVLVAVACVGLQAVIYVDARDFRNQDGKS